MSYLCEIPLQLINLYAAAANRWRGCDWKTEFGPARLNLANLRSVQLHLLVSATAGQESQNWAEAESWLQQVEKDAYLAEDAAYRATRQYVAGDLRGAVASINEACKLEAQYHAELVWAPLRDFLRSEVAKIGGM
ncbi:hypothetical protein C5Y97_02275 [Blastopirellula marina]|uniref:Uncharacterized protein n=1 Tax=Blastopirellula marina TaxID=124 RepID=A0A2S8GBS8_9BACT|nr:hypothetical protein C5Y98_02275 [Blastopirellula marina]PTL46241.1 hypothetical protein C5Y97_02275 [Blastopirellula marina]